MRNRTKLYFCDLIDADINYDYFARGKIGNVRGWVYHLCKGSVIPEEWFKTYKNIRSLIAYSRYAPDMRIKAIFIGDKCFGNGRGVSK